MAVGGDGGVAMISTDTVSIETPEGTVQVYVVNAVVAVAVNRTVVVPLMVAPIVTVPTVERNDTEATMVRVAAVVGTTAGKPCTLKAP